ncbi:hypothetical protein H5410_029430 [Solanum commersonii]|uniref:SWIRM domain-containing protein n=1 Tax=Solanum commersonii TaxID=4109 RepID=A0A9J5Z5L5_SOLCO|nr:hypothetical protein H5410_029430 [Solanum commersonii]
MNRRRGRSGSKLSLDEVSNDFLSNTNEEQSALVSSSSSGKASKTQVKSSDSSNRNVNSKVVRSRKSRKEVVSDEAICINKESNSEALVALMAGFPSDSLKDEEIEVGVVSVVGGIEQCNYILIRKHIITKWRENVSILMTKDMFVDVILERCSGLLDFAYNYLLSYGYANFGVALAIKDKIPTRPSKGRVMVIGAGLVGLAVARQLMLFGFEVIVLEGRKCAGRRVYTKKMEGGNKVATADLGGSVLTGTLGNPLGLLARQLSYTLHTVRDQCPLYCADGMPIDKYLDKKVEAAYNKLVDKASKVRQELSQLSLAFWDQDDPYDMGGDRCFLPVGNGRLVHALAENVPIIFQKLFPLRVLKSGSITFIPELPQQKLDTIERLGFGLLNKADGNPVDEHLDKKVVLLDKVSSGKKFSQDWKHRSISSLQEYSNLEEVRSLTTNQYKGQFLTCQSPKARAKAAGNYISSDIPNR